MVSTCNATVTAAGADATICKSQSSKNLPDGERGCYPVVSNIPSSRTPNMECMNATKALECDQVSALPLHRPTNTPFIQEQNAAIGCMRAHFRTLSTLEPCTCISRD